MSAIFRDLLASASRAGRLDIAPALREIPPTVLDHYGNEFGIEGEMASLFQAMNVTWSALHGMVSLEVYNHLAPVVGDTDAFFEQSMRQSLRAAGVMID